MNQQTSKILLSESIRIGDEILSQAKYDDIGIYWETVEVRYDLNKLIEWKFLDNIYSGTPGIILYIIALYDATKDNKYKRIIECKIHFEIL